MSKQVLPGETILAEPGYLRGHGTFLSKNGELTSCVWGQIERVNKLVSVRPRQSRYVGEVGDVVIGRVTEIGARRWRVDVGGRQDALLLLSAIHLPGGVQRRKTEADELQMHEFFAERDLVCAEVQQFYADGTMLLHTRNLRYGRLEPGLLLNVPTGLLVRSRSSFHTLACGVLCTIGWNGAIYLRPPKDSTGGIVHEKVARVANIIQALVSSATPIFPEQLDAAYHETMALSASDIRSPVAMARWIPSLESLDLARQSRHQ